MDSSREFFGVICGSIPLIIGGVLLYYIAKFTNDYHNQEKWCESCNSWHMMKRRLTDINGISGWDCPNCKWINQKAIGSCHCGWFERYEITTVSRRGPFRKVDRQDVDLFYGVQTEYWAYELQIKCPKHGIYTAYVPVDVYERSGRND